MDEPTEPAPYTNDYSEQFRDKESIAGDVGNQAYMILFALFIFWFIVWKIVWWCMAIGGATWIVVQLTRVHPPTRAWVVNSRIMWTSAFRNLFRFIALSFRKKTPEVNSEMGQLQGIMTAPRNTLLSPAAFLTPTRLVLIGMAAFFTWGAFGWWVRLPMVKDERDTARANSATAVDANEGVAIQLERYRSALAIANARIEAQAKDAQVTEDEAFQRGRMDERRRIGGRQKQRRLEDEARSPGNTAPDPAVFLRDIGLGGAPDGSADSGSPPADPGDTAPPDPG